MMVRGDFTIREGIVKWIKLRREQSKVWALYLYLSFRVVNDIGSSVRRLKAGFAPDAGDQMTLTTGPGVSVAVLSGQAGAGGQELLVAGGALHLAGVPVSLKFCCGPVRWRRAPRESVHDGAERG